MKKKKQKNNHTQRSSWYDDLRPETRHSVLAVFSFAVGAVILLAYFGNAGVIGNMTNRLFTALFGNAFLLVPLMFFIVGIGLLRALRPRLVMTTLVGGAMVLLAVLGAVDAISGEATAGYVGFFFAYPLLRFFDFWASIVLLSAFGIAGLVVMLNIPLWPRRAPREEQSIPPPQAAAEPEQDDRAVSTDDDDDDDDDGDPET